METSFEESQELQWCHLCNEFRHLLLNADVVLSLFPNWKDGNKSGLFNIEVKGTEAIEFRIRIWNFIWSVIANVMQKKFLEILQLVSKICFLGTVLV